MSDEKKILKNSSKIILDHDLKELLRILNSIKIGSVTLIIHDGKVVKIEKNEKLILE